MAQIKKMSEIFKEMALTLFRNPKSIPSTEAAYAALLFTHVAWNRAVGETFTDGECRKVLRTFEKSRRSLWAELRSRDWHVMINELIAYKNAHYPNDQRIVVVCGMTAKKNVHVEWMDPVEGHAKVAPSD